METTQWTSMIKFKSYLSFWQYMPAKPIKWGVKVGTLAESETGYIYHFQVYTGKATTWKRQKGLGHRVVTDLVRPLRNRNVWVFMDIFFTSVALLKELHTAGVYACEEKHQCRVAQDHVLTFAMWQDTRPVLGLSNYHEQTAEGTVNRRTDNAEQVPVRVQRLFADYQRCMRGVDLSDQMIGYHIIHHRSKTWWRRVFLHFMMKMRRLQAGQDSRFREIIPERKSVR